MTVSLHSLLKTMVEKNGTDLHVTTNSPPLIRIDGTLVTLSHPPMTAVDTKKLAYSVLTDAQKHRFEETLELDISFGVKGRSGASRTRSSGSASSDCRPRLRGYAADPVVWCWSPVPLAPENPPLSPP